MDLITSHTTASAILMPTCRCNLRCVYCSFSHVEPSEYFDMPEELLWYIVEALIQRGTKAITLSGGGEPTLRKGWHLIADRLLEQGISLSLVTNFVRKLNPLEAETLARFTQITISCDTVDPKLFAEIRRPGGVETILKNLSLVRTVAQNRCIPGPKFEVNMVVTDRSVFSLEETVRLMNSRGVSQFSFSDLSKYMELDGAVNVYPVDSLPLQELLQAYKALLTAQKTVLQLGATYACHPSLLASIQARLSSGAEDCETRHGWTGTLLEEGMTRGCLDPWMYALIEGNGNIQVCCYCGQVMGKVDASRDLESVLNGSSVKELRRQLLTGDLPSACKKCPAKHAVRPEQLVEAVKEYLGGNSSVRGLRIWT